MLIADVAMMIVARTTVMMQRKTMNVVMKTMTMHRAALQVERE